MESGWERKQGIEASVMNKPVKPSKKEIKKRIKCDQNISFATRNKTSTPFDVRPLPYLDDGK